MDLYVINLNERVDRYNHILKTFKDFNIKRVEAIQHENPVLGCFLSHKKCIQYAKDKKMDYIIVLEDDCTPINKDTFKKDLENVIKYLKSNKNWYLYLGCGNSLKGENILEKLDNKLYKVNLSKTAHFIIYNHKIYNYILNVKNPHNDHICPIDKIWHNKFNAIMSIPFLTTQISGYSNIEKKYMEYTPRFKFIQKRLSKHIRNNM